MARNTHYDLRSALPDPLLSDMYKLIIPKFGAESITILCQQVSLPAVTVEPVEAALGGMSSVYAGRVIYSHDLTITFVENRTLTVYNTLINWYQTARTYLTQQGNYKENYSTEAQIEVYDQMGNSPVQRFILYYLWCSGVPEIQFDSSSSNLVTISATFQYDYWQSVQLGNNRADQDSRMLGMPTINPGIA